jgi:hypothetical protein
MRTFAEFAFWVTLAIVEFVILANLIGAVLSHAWK